MFSVVRDFDNENSFVDNSPFINNASFKNDETINENKTDKVMKDIMDVLKINLKDLTMHVDDKKMKQEATIQVGSINPDDTTYGDKVSSFR